MDNKILRIGGEHAMVPFDRAGDRPYVIAVGKDNEFPHLAEWLEWEPKQVAPVEDLSPMKITTGAIAPNIYTSPFVLECWSD
jgi:hypothetical protein